MLGLNLEQLLILAGVGVALVILLWVLKAVLKATRVVLRFGCVAIAIILVILFVVMRVIPG